MKQIYRFIALIVLCSLSGPDLMAQITPQRILGTFLLKDSVYNFEFLKSSEDKFTFKVTGTRDNKTVEKNDSTNDNQNLAELPSTVDEAQSDFTVYLSEFNKEIFIVSFGKLMRDKFKVPTLDSKDKATEVFFKILARLGFIDDEPVTAYLILKQDSIRSFLRVNQSAYYNSILSWPYVMHTVELVNVETEDGAIKNVSAHLTPLPGGKSNPRQFLEFKNQSPISISGKFDADKFAHVKLYCNNCAGVEGLSRYIKLSELLALDIVYENDKEDYSPSNKTIALSHNQPLVELRKEQRSKILEIAAFSDFVGLDQEEPNGLVQIEARRRLNINTKSYRFKSTSGFEDLLNRYNVRDVIILSKKDSATNKYIGYNVYKRLDSSLIESISTKSIKQRESFYGYLTYFEPRLLFAKLEGNRRLVDSSKINNGRLDPVSVFQQQLVSFGINLQVLRFSYPQWKLNWNVLNVGGYWFRTRVATSSDSAAASIALNNHYWDINTSMIFRPDSRWGASVGFGYLLPRIWNNAYKLSKRNGLLQNQFDAFLKTGAQGKLFFRFRWTYENRNKNSNFTQLQLGYSSNLFAAKGNQQP